MTKIGQEINNIFTSTRPDAYQQPVYKFVSRRHLDGFFQTGSIRLGTLHEFRDIETYGVHRGDATEGKNNVVQAIAFTDEIEPGSFLSKFIAPGRGFQIADCSFVEERDFPDCYVFCTSAYFTEELFRHWHEKEGVDACYEIFDWQAYQREITKRVSQVAFSIGSRYVTYVKGDISGESHHRNISPPLIKQEEYSWQREFRGVWFHKPPSIGMKAICMEIPEARKYCRKVAILEGGNLRFI